MQSSEDCPSRRKREGQPQSKDLFVYDAIFAFARSSIRKAVKPSWVAKRFQRCDKSP
jgi:hypothetical protein